jgi:hypothetical protein
MLPRRELGDERNLKNLNELIPLETRREIRDALWDGEGDEVAEKKVERYFRGLEARLSGSSQSGTEDDSEFISGEMVASSRALVALPEISNSEGSPRESEFTPPSRRLKTLAELQPSSLDTLLQRAIPNLRWHALSNLGFQTALGSVLAVHAMSCVLLPQAADSTLGGKHLVLIGVPLSLLSYHWNFQYLSGKDEDLPEYPLVYLAYGFLSHWLELIVAIFVLGFLLFARVYWFERQGEVLELWYANAEQGAALSNIQSQIYGAQLVAYSQGARAAVEEAKRQWQESQEAKLQEIIGTERGGESEEREREEERGEEGRESERWGAEGWGVSGFGIGCVMELEEV